MGGFFVGTLFSPQVELSLNNLSSFSEKSYANGYEMTPGFHGAKQIDRSGGLERRIILDPFLFLIF